MTPILTFDIETVPDCAGIRRLYELPESLPERARMVLWNPFAQMLDLLRAPLMGNISDIHNWTSMLSWTAVNLVAAAMLFSKYRRRVVYWL